ncbi:amidohydrolase family protein [Streptomyces sp. NPDC058220]|uniref:amidohydrolase family protein n=1 Tax=Streptomyces sp. NPDC058220 TaxID=3346387 RepID=UPI0036E598FA
MEPTGTHSDRALPHLAGPSRRSVLQAAGVTAGAALTPLASTPAARALGQDRRTLLTFTAATNGTASLAPSGDRLIAEIQGVLWDIPRRGGDGVALTPPDLEPVRPVHSPDGKLLAVCAYRGGGFHIWTLRPDGSELRQLTDGPWDDRGPSWSPDGSRIAFASERGGSPATGGAYRIWTLDIRTGALARITGLTGQDGPGDGGPVEDFDPVWSPDGTRVLFVRGRFTDGAFQARTIASVLADGAGAVRTVHTDAVAGARILAPALSRDHRLAYLRTTSESDEPNSSSTLVIDGEDVAVSGDVLPVPPRWTPSGQLLLNVDGAFVLLEPASGDREVIPFSARLPVSRPRYRVKRHDLDSTRTRPVRGIHLPALSPDGRQVVFAALNALWTAGTSGGGAPRRLVQAAPTHYVQAPVWTPDGSAVLYADDRDGQYAIRRHELATHQESVLATGGRIHPALSPDGSRLAHLDISGNLIVRDLATGTDHTLAAPLGGGGLPGRPTWAPDGRHLALCDRNRLNHRFREGYNVVRVVDATTGADRLHAVAPHASISDRYDSGPVWSPDGATMALICESALWLLPVRSDGTPDGVARRVTDEPADHPSWSGDSRTVLYLSSGRLRLLDVGEETDGKPRTVPLSLGYHRPAPADTVVHAGQLWTGTGETRQDDVDIIVRDGRVTGIERHRPRRGTGRTVDASDRTVIPGLWDAHTHPWQYTYGGRQTLLQLAYGITTAVSLGGFAYEQARIRESVVAGRMAGPRLLTTGELLDGSRVAYTMGRAHRTSEGLRRSLARGAALEWDFVKTYVRASAGFMAEAARSAHELGVRAGSHLCAPGIQTGQDLTTHLHATQRAEFGHAISATGHSYQDLTEIYTAGDFTMIATPFSASPLIGADPALAADDRVTRLMPPWDIEMVRQLASRPPSPAELTLMSTEVATYRRVLAGGGLVALGTDSPLTPVGLQLHMALRALHRYGLSPVEALRTATVLPARVLGLDRDLGTVEPGKIADLTIVDGDPFTDFDSLVRTHAVLTAGTLVRRTDLVAARPAAGHDDRERWLAVSRRMREDTCCAG